MPDLVKIGYTKRDPKKRAAELYEGSKIFGIKAVTGVPGPFEVHYTEPCPKYKDLESIVHKELAELRFNEVREFFRFPDRSEAIRRVQEIHRKIHPGCKGSTSQDDVPINGGERGTEETGSESENGERGPSTPDADDGIWRKHTSHFLTRFKRMSNTE